MKQIIIISFFLFSFSSCSVNKIDLNLVNPKNVETNYNSLSGRYLAANHSILKGDFFNTNKILESNNNDLTLLNLKFFSNLVSGNFEIANNISKKNVFKVEDQFLYKIPEFVINVKKNNFKIGLQIASQNQSPFGFDKISLLLKYWKNLSELKNNNKLTAYNKNYFKLPIYKLLILENFYNIKELKIIADYNNNLESLSNIDLFFLAGFYYRYGDFEKFEKIIKNKISDNFDKNYILNKFSSTENIFNNKSNIQTILSLYLYDIASQANSTNENSSSYIAILLEMSLYFCPYMDVSKYLLAELYTIKKSQHTAFNKLNQIDKKSFFALPASLKKLSILKDFQNLKSYQKLLFKLYKKWPNNKLILYELASFYKSNNNYNHALKIYKKLIKVGDTNNQLLFLYAICLDKLGRWEEAKKIFLNLVKNDKSNPYTLNYLAFSMAIKKENLSLASELINRALILDINNGFFLDTMGWIEFQKNNYETSLFFLEKAVILEPSNSEIIDHLADCYLKLGRNNEALYEWKKALKYENTKDALNLITIKIKKYE